MHILYNPTIDQLLKNAKTATSLNATIIKIFQLVILIAGIFPRANSNGAHGSQSDGSTYLVSDMRCSLYLTLDQQVVFSVARITGVANLPPKDVV